MRTLRPLCPLWPMLLLILAGRFPCPAQRVQETFPLNGLRPTGSYSPGDTDTVDVVNGYVHLEIPLTSLPPSRGKLNMDLKLIYDSAIYDTQFVIKPFNGQDKLVDWLAPSLAGGWHYNMQAGLQYEERPLPPGVNFCQDPQHFEDYRVYKMSAIFPDGSRHLLRLKGYPDVAGDGYYAIHPNKIRLPCAPANSELPPPGRLTYFTDDGTYVKVILEDSPSGYDWALRQWTMYFPDGSSVVGNNDQIAHIVDPNGNWVVVSKVFDPLTGFPVTRYLSLNHGIDITHGLGTDTIRRKGYGGSTDLTWTVNWGLTPQLTLGYQCTGDPVRETCWDDKTRHNVVTSVLLPSVGTTTALQYNFAYDVSNYGWGELQQITFPSDTPGTPKVEYDYQYKGYVKLYEERLRNPVAHRKLYDGDQHGSTNPEIWTYVINGDSSTITAPDGGVTTNFYFDRRILSTWYRGLVYRTLGPLGSGVIRTWGRNRPYSVEDQAQGNPFVKSEFRVTGNASARQKMAGRTYSIDKNGNLIELREYDWESYNVNGAQPSAPALRTLTNSYYVTTDTADDGGVSPADSNSAYWNELSPANRSAVKRTSIQEGAAGPVAAFTEYAYDDPLTKGNVTQQRRWDSQQSAAVPSTFDLSNSVIRDTQYTSFGNPLIVKDEWQYADSSRGYTEYAYDAGIPGCPFGNGALLYPTTVYTARTTAVQRQQSLYYDCATGAVISSTDFQSPQNVTTIHSYDLLGRQTAGNEASLRSSSMQYDDGKRWLWSKQDLYAFNDGRFQRMTHFDFLGRVRLQRSTDAGGTALDTNGEVQGEKVETKYYRSYSDGFNYEATSNPYASTTPSAGRGWTRIKRDKLGRVVETETFDGSTPPSPWGVNTASSGVAKIDYDSEVQVQTDQWQKTRTLRYDALERLAQVTDGAGTTYYAYDALDNLTYACQNGTPPASVCTGGQKRAFVYSSLKRLVSATNPESGTTNYTYYDNGLLHTKTDALGKVVTYNYDALNRLTTKSYSDATPAVTYTYDSPSVPYSRGRLTKVSSTASTTDYVSYDALGRVTSSKQTLPGQPAYTFGYGYSPFGLSQITYPSGRVIFTAYDGAGRQAAVSQQKNSAGSLTLLAVARYAPQGTYSRLDYGNGVCEWVWYNGRMQPYGAGVRRWPSAWNMPCDDQTPSETFIAQHGWS
ncbi:MAG: hypothetical protein LC126_28835, partial [Bryobacterales bacterium]|nr:hypothetical protein [Bryobacterales bacterium]